MKKNLHRLVSVALLVAVLMGLAAPTLAVYDNPLIVKSGLDYDSVILRDDGYFEIEKDDKYGLLDKNGNELVPPVYDQLGKISGGMMKVYQGKAYDDTQKYGFVDMSTGKLTIPIQYNNANTDDVYTKISDFSNGFAVLSRSEHIIYQGPNNLPFSESKTQCGLIDKSGNMVIPMQDVDYVWSMGNGAMTYDFSDNRVVAKSGDKYIVMDTQGNILFEPKFKSVAGYENGFAIIGQNEKYGFMDTQGNVIVTPQYDSVSDFRGGYAIVEKNRRYGAVNQQGKLVVPIEYELLYDFSDGMACFGVSDRNASDGAYKYGFVNTSGEVTMPAIWDATEGVFNNRLKFSNGLAHVAIADERFNGIVTDAGDGVASMQRKHGYIDKQGNVVIPPIYDSAGSFSNGIAYADIGVADLIISGLVGGDEVFYEEAESRFRELGIKPEYKYIDTAGNVILSADTPFPYGTERFYVDKINGEFAIMRNPIYRENAAPNRSTVLVDGQAVAFDAYTINGNNYFKLRDLAKVLSGTGKQFEVTWDGNAKAINMLSGKPYTTVGGELAQGDGANKTAAINTAIIYLDGQPIYLTAYTINQNNYFKLRDVGQAFDFDVTWDGARNTIVIDTTQSYAPD